MYERNWSYIKKEKFNNILEVKVRKFEYGFQKVVEDIKNCRKTEGKKHLYINLSIREYGKHQKVPGKSHVKS